MLWLVATLSTLFAATGILVVRYMRVPRVKRLSISALRFLPDLTPATRDRVEWRLSSPLTSRLFWLRILCILALAATVVLLGAGGSVPLWHEDRIGLRILVDRSPSMALGSPPRIDQALALLSRLKAAVEGQDGCVVVEGVPSSGDSGSATGFGLVKDGVPPQHLWGALDPQGDPPTSSPYRCSVTQVAVISDQPRPNEALLSSHEGGQRAAHLWFQVGQPEWNVALRDAHLATSFLTGHQAVMTVMVDDYGPAGGTPTLTVTDPAGRVVMPNDGVDMAAPGSKQVGFLVATAGTYRASLRNGGGLALDDELQIDVEDLNSPLIDLSPTIQDPEVRSVLSRLGRIGPASHPDDLFIGAMPPVGTPLAGTVAALARPGLYFVHGNPADAGTELGMFDAGSPVLNGVDIDLLEAMRPNGVTSLPPGFRAVASGVGTAGAAWIAVRDGSNPAVILPSRPSLNTAAALAQEMDRTWWVLVLNAYRMVAKDRMAAVNIDHVAPDGWIVTGASYESDTAQAIGESDRITDIRPPTSQPQGQSEVWPWLLCLTILLLLIERLTGLRRTWIT